jgi:predicted amidohydrolase
MIADSMIVNPNGEIGAEAKTEGDEVIVAADCDLDPTILGKERCKLVRGPKSEETPCLSSSPSRPTE